MTYLIIGFGLLTFLAGIMILINPESIFGLLRGNLESPGLHLVAIGVRLVLGILLILYAGESSFPVIVTILGWLSVVAALVFAVIGRQRFIALMNWAFGLLKPYGRLGGLFAAAFGGFLVYAFI